MRTEIDSVIMRQRADELTGRHKDLFDALRAAKETINLVAEETKGKGTEAFCERWMQEQPAIERACDCVEEFAKAARNIADIFDETQTQIVKALKV